MTDRDLEPKRLPGLDGLRCLSVSFVLATHVGLYFPRGYPSAETAWNDRWVGLVHGVTGVSIFFVLSGYLITSLLLDERQRYGRISLHRFYLRRILRIWPCYVAFLLVVSSMVATDLLQISMPGLLVPAACLTNFISRAHYSSELGHTWSLAVEEHFYLLWPLLLVGLSVRRLLVTTVLAIFLCIGLHHFWDHFPHVGSTYFPDRWTLPGAMGILIGCGTALLRTLPEHQDRWTRFASSGRAAALGTVLYVAPLWLPGPMLPSVLAWQDSGVALIMMWLLLHPQAGATRVLEWAPIAFLGRMSYGIYVWQGLFLGTGPGGRLWIQQPPQDLVLTLLVAFASYRWIEGPFLALKRTFSR